jgi:competence protein ComEA
MNSKSLSLVLAFAVLMFSFGIAIAQAPEAAPAATESAAPAATPAPAPEPDAAVAPAPTPEPAAPAAPETTTAPPPAAAPAETAGLVNVNTATPEEIGKVKGIGAKTGIKIVAYRDEFGAFKTLDELINVKSIGEKKLAKFRDKVTVGDGVTCTKITVDCDDYKKGKAAKSPKAAEGVEAAAAPALDAALKPAKSGKSAKATAENPVNVNTADEKTLMTLPKIGKKTAQAILEYREKNGSFKSLEDLGKVKGLGKKTLANLEKLVLFEGASTPAAGGEKPAVEGAPTTPSTDAAPAAATEEAGSEEEGL